jgi:hypothetical protein
VTLLTTTTLLICGSFADFTPYTKRVRRNRQTSLNYLLTLKTEAA